MIIYVYRITLFLEMAAVCFLLLPNKFFNFPVLQAIPEEGKVVVKGHLVSQSFDTQTAFFP